MGGGVGLGTLGVTHGLGPEPAGPPPPPPRAVPSSSAEILTREWRKRRKYPWEREHDRESNYDRFASLNERAMREQMGKIRAATDSRERAIARDVLFAQQREERDGPMGLYTQQDRQRRYDAYMAAAAAAASEVHKGGDPSYWDFAEPGTFSVGAAAGTSEHFTPEASTPQTPHGSVDERPVDEQQLSVDVLDSSGSVIASLPGAQTGGSNHATSDGGPSGARDTLGQPLPEADYAVLPIGDEAVIQALDDGMLEVFADPKAGLRAVLTSDTGTRHIYGGIGRLMPRRVKAGDPIGVTPKVASKSGRAEQSNAQIGIDHAAPPLGGGPPPRAQLGSEGPGPEPVAGARIDSAAPQAATAPPPPPPGVTHYVRRRLPPPDRGRGAIGLLLLLGLGVVVAARKSDRR
jgi:hypothetical protein